MSRRTRQRAERHAEARSEDIAAVLNSVRIAPTLTRDERRRRRRAAKSAAKSSPRFDKPNPE